MQPTLSLALAVVLAAGTALAQDPAPRVVNGQTFGQWTVSCEALAVGETACVLNQQLFRSSDRAFLAQFLALWSTDGTQRFLLARVPTGVDLPAGLVMKPDRPDTDDQTIAFVWQTCNATVCEALAELDAARTAAYLQGDAGIIASYRPALGADPVTFRFAATGLIEGMDALRPPKP